MTIAKRIAKNGTKMYYVRDNETGKLSRISREKAEEIEAANNAEEPATVEKNAEDNNAVVIPIVDYRTLLTWAEKVSNGQHDTAIQIVTHVKKWFNADADKATVIEAIKTGDLNGFRNFLTQFKFVVKDDCGYLHKLYRYDNGECVLAEIPTSEYVKYSAGEAANTVDETAPEPTDDYAAKLVALKAKQAAAKAELDGKTNARMEAQTALENAHVAEDIAYAEWRAADDDVKRLLNVKAKELTDTFWRLPLVKIKITSTIGKEFTSSCRWAVTTMNNNFRICDDWDFCGEYDTPAQVEAVISRLKASIERGDTQFTFPTIDDLTKPVTPAKEPVTDTELPAPALTPAQIKAADIMKLFEGYHMKFGRADNSKGTTCNGKPFNHGLTLYYEAEGHEDDYITAFTEYFTGDDSYILEAVTVMIDGRYYGRVEFDTEPVIEYRKKLAAIDRAHIEDSLTRAMKTALEYYKGFCRIGNLTAAEHELKLYNICRKATRELLKEW